MENPQTSDPIDTQQLEVLTENAELSQNGTSIASRADVHSVTDTKKSKHKWLGRRLVITVLIVLAMVAVGFGAAAWTAGSQIRSAKQVSNLFLQDLMKGNGPAAYQLTSSGFQQYTDKNTLAIVASLVHKNIRQQPSVTSWNITTVAKSSETATINYEAKGTSESGNITTTVQKINGKWQVIGIHFPAFITQ